MKKLAALVLFFTMACVLTTFPVLAQEPGFSGLDTASGRLASSTISLDFQEVNEQEAATLLAILDMASELPENERFAFIESQVNFKIRIIGNKLVSQVKELLNNESSEELLNEFIEQRDRLFLLSSSSPLYQKIVIPQDLSAPPASRLELSYWRGPRSEKTRKTLAKLLNKSGNSPSTRHQKHTPFTIIPGPALYKAIRSSLLFHVSKGHKLSAGKLRKAVREATHAIRSVKSQQKLSIAARFTRNSNSNSNWPYSRHNSELDEKILGALVYLDDTQIRDRVGRLTCTIDSSETGEGCTSKLVYNTAFSVRDLELPMLFDISVRNNYGQWASFIHTMPNLWNKIMFSGRSKLMILQDSNLFITAFVIYPLLMIDDESGIIDGMLDPAMDFIKTCKRGPAYAFWPRLPKEITPHDIIGPPNTPYGPLHLVGRFLLNPKIAPIAKKMTEGKHLHMSAKTFKEFMNPDINPAGIEAVVNIPPDADDTSVTVAAQVLFAKRRGGSPAPDLDALHAITKFRDVNRSKEEGTDSWKGLNSGGYLTWIKDENQPTLSDMKTGFIPLEVNNVDAVVQANVLFGLTMARLTDVPGYDDCKALVAKVAKEHLWPGANMYYPQHMIFPYVASRAFRDAGVNDPKLRDAMKQLLKDVIREQIPEGTYRLTPPHRPAGAFPGTPDKSLHLSTALACCCLLNLGEDLAKEADVLDKYRTSLDRGISFLLREAKRYKVRDKATFAYTDSKRPQGYVWHEGLFFSSGTEAMAYWRSEPYTVATVLEALLKYRLGYDKHQKSIKDSPHIELLPPEPSSKGFRLGISWKAVEAK